VSGASPRATGGGEVSGPSAAAGAAASAAAAARAVVAARQRADPSRLIAVPLWSSRRPDAVGPSARHSPDVCPTSAGRQPDEGPTSFSKRKRALDRRPFVEADRPCHDAFRSTAVGEELFNVTFHFGSCAETFEGCDSSSDLLFQSLSQAELATERFIFRRQEY